MPRFKCIIEYDGTGLAGWQRQPDQPTVQGHLETALRRITGESVEIHASGRTDAGVHARGQVIHFDVEEIEDADKLMGSINFFLRPNAIVIVSIEEVDEDFHARFSAKMRHYCYHIINRRAPLVLDRKRAWHVAVPLDIQAMQEAASYLEGHHDFSSFRDAECQAKSPEKTLTSLTLTKEGELLSIHASAPSFLHHMVRNLTGTLKYVGEGRFTPGEVKQILAAKHRPAAGPTAPAEGLYFMKVEYDI